MFSFKSSNRRCSAKKVFLKISQISQENICLFLIKLQVCRLSTLLKRDSNTGILLWNLRNFKNNNFEEYLRTAASVVAFSWLYVHYLRHRFINQK